MNTKAVEFKAEVRALQAAMGRYTTSADRARDRFKELGCKLDGLRLELTRPSSEVIVSMTKAVDGMADIVDWIAERVEVLVQVADTAVDAVKFRLDAEDVPSIMEVKQAFEEQIEEPN